ncbi:TDT family transporter [Clostridium sporogenes]|uniref:TDT family transporter n=1 Tax=Clostridium TaxID=1485 RepID=UPI0006ABD8F6|nr:MULTISPECIES: TDT family transporter [Clostridium]EJP6471217.1 TDT family transporter [Clostridium botulinum]KOR24020.1 C4-dicarboxylate ABC transporter [Clostridium sp. L74]NFV12093.1 TDT family transporter [Clostridium sporogenes]
MNEFLKKYPVPIVGLMLGLAAAGNLVQSYGEGYRNIFGVVSAILLVLMIGKIIKYPKDIAKSLDNPVVASVFPTLSMGIMLLSTYCTSYLLSFAYAMWIIGIVLHIMLILWFTKKFVLNFKIKQVFPSWFIVYVGIVVASVTAPVYKMANVGQVVFWFGFVTYLILLPIVIYRVIKVKEMPEPTLPTIAIFAAPASLLLAGYMKSFETKNMTIVWFLMILSVLMYVSVIIMLFKLLKLKFYPSYSGFTFPLIISGISIKLTNGFLIKSKQAIPWLKYLVKFQEITAVIITIYVLIRYIQFLLPKENNSVSINKSN